MILHACGLGNPNRARGQAAPQGRSDTVTSLWSARVVPPLSSASSSPSSVRGTSLLKCPRTLHCRSPPGPHPTGASGHAVDEAEAEHVAWDFLSWASPQDAGTQGLAPALDAGRAEVADVRDDVCGILWTGSPGRAVYLRFVLIRRIQSKAPCTSYLPLIYVRDHEEEDRLTCRFALEGLQGNRRVPCFPPFFCRITGRLCVVRPCLLYKGNSGLCTLCSPLLEGLQGRRAQHPRLVLIRSTRFSDVLLASTLYKDSWLILQPTRKSSQASVTSKRSRIGVPPNTPCKSLSTRALLASPFVNPAFTRAML